MKIAVNRCYGGFSVSEQVFKELGLKWNGFGYLRNDDFGIESTNYFAWRSHPKLIQAIEKIGVEKASGKLAEIDIVDIPDDIKFEIDDYDGVETVHEEHRSW
jgi:hypothetical protein